MIKNVIKRFFPKLDTVKEEKILKIFGPAVLQPNLWHINKKSVSRGFAIGAFCAFLPIPGQMILAAFLSITFAANIPISLVLTWITNPITFTPIFYFAYKIGKIIFDGRITYDVDEKEIDILSNIMHIWEPLLLGSIILSITGSIVAYIIIRVYWRYYVIKIWSKRKK
tara:strand:- start:210 stop:713 length:504 start_codon:yes stop_codon:yes gene_type:complete